MQSVTLSGGCFNPPAATNSGTTMFSPHRMNDDREKSWGWEGKVDKSICFCEEVAEDDI